MRMYTMSFRLLASSFRHLTWPWGLRSDSASGSGCVTLCLRGESRSAGRDSKPAPSRPFDSVWLCHPFGQAQGGLRNEQGRL